MEKKNTQIWKKQVVGNQFNALRVKVKEERSGNHLSGLVFIQILENINEIHLWNPGSSLFCAEYFPREESANAFVEGGS